MIVETSAEARNHAPAHAAHRAPVMKGPNPPMGTSFSPKASIVTGAVGLGIALLLNKERLARPHGLKTVGVYLFGVGGLWNITTGVLGYMEPKETAISQETSQKG